MKKRITVIILALCTALTSFFTPRVLSAQALSAPEIEILYDGETVNDLLISQTQKYEITALCNPESDGCGYRWQICADTKASLWVDIYGANERSLKVSYPMISSLLDDAGSVYLRCAVTLSGEAYFSGPINITVAFDAKEADPPAEAENVAKEIPETPAAVYSLKAARVALLSEEETEYVYITINYRDSVSGEAIYSPYTAKIEKGTAFNQTVISPTFLGYAPHYKDSEGNKGEACPSVVFNETNLDTDITKDVFYYPIEVPYAIRYFFQNINDDLYTERAELYHTDKALTGTIISNEKLESHAGDTTGFSKLYHYPESVAADGSTVFECYYDRNYYLLKFDTDGGYGSEPIYARYGTPFIVNDPVKPGYVFKGWDLLDEDGKGDGVTDTLPSTIPAANQSYKALWESITTDVTVVYWLQDPNNADKYNYWGSYTTTAQSGTEIQATDYKDYSINTALNNSLNIYEKRYSTFNEEKTNAMVFVQGDGSTVVNVYYDRKEYTLKFYYAMSSGSGTNTKYYVIGGTTYYFGAYTNNGDEIALLDQYMSTYSDQRGQVTLLPALNERGNGRSYTQSYDTSTVSGTAYNYYYISFKAKYGADITNLWPCDVFGSVERSTANTHGKWTGTTAYVSAWNGEHHVYYSLHNSNQTIKGNYNTLDYNLLWDYNSYGDSDTVAYLCFWENGANIGWSVPKLFRYNIYLPRLDGTGYDLSVSYDTFDDSNVYSQTPPAISGFTFDNYTYSEITGYDKNKYNGAYDMNFYYTRNPYTLNFYNYNKYIDEKKETVYFETPLGSKFFIPDYPDKLEENAYEFVGWYTSPGCYDGTEFGDINGFGDNTMPAHDLTLYAKWVPKTHTVRFFQTYQDKLNYEKNGDTSGIIETKVISHGNTVGAIDNPTDKSGYDYTFGGWFYEKNSEKIAFTPLDTPVKEDVNVFADWGSHTAQPYLLHYVLKTAETEDVWKTAAYEAAGGSPAEQKRYEVTVGTETRGYVYYEGGWHLCVADDTTGYAYAGSTRTFTAKAGDPLNQLYSAYNSGYFPTLASHSITVQFENNAAQPEKNVFTFTYVYATNVSYTVKYLDKNTGLPLKADEHKTTDYSVVTERFAVIENYVPDAFYKRLVISVKEDPENPGNYVGSEDNVIIFYYTQNETAAFYAVHFMLRKLGATGDNYAIDGSGDYYESD
ncbi:MAG: InlB B-repeat-containing protein, partial [Acutalibacteraceae bacterium]